MQLEVEQELDNEIAEELPAKEYDVENMSKDEIKLVNFVQDIVLRKLAKEIQRERDLLRRQDEEEWQAMYGEKEDNPYVITVADIQEKLQEKINAAAQNQRNINYNISTYIKMLIRHLSSYGSKKGISVKKSRLQKKSNQ